MRDQKVLLEDILESIKVIEDSVKGGFLKRPEGECYPPGLFDKEILNNR